MQHLIVIILLEGFKHVCACYVTYEKWPFVREAMFNFVLITYVNAEHAL